MKTTKIFLFCLLIMFAGVALAQDVKTDYDHTVNFSKYRTFMWVKEPKPANPLMKDRIIEAVNAQLGEKGLRLVAENADIGVSANVATREEHTLESFYDGFGWGWHRHWGGPVTTTVQTYEVGTLVVDLFDAQRKQVVWWGAASDTLSDKPEKNTKKLNQAVDKMFKDFPPKNSPKTD